MSWHFSRALVEVCSAHTYSDSSLYAPSSLTLMHEAYYWPDKTTEHSRLSQFGMTSEHLTGGLGEMWLTWFLADSLARTSASAAKATGWTANAADYGQKWRGSFVKYDQDSCSWKTHQLLLAGDSERFSGTWPRWGLMRGGECWELTTPELPTCGTDYGLWPTPCASDSSDRKASPNPHLTRNGTLKHIGKSGVLSQIRLSQAVKHFATPKHMDGPLNPAFPEWLMGWPIGHTDLKPLETDKFREWQRQHSIFSPVGEFA